MARYVAIVAFLAVVVAATVAQDYFGGFSRFADSPRDPRQNRGPVTFPVTSPGSETSGVRVGASGYGFIPPGGRPGFGAQGSGPNPGLDSFYPQGFSELYW